MSIYNILDAWRLVGGMLTQTAEIGLIPSGIMTHDTWHDMTQLSEWRIEQPTRINWYNKKNMEYLAITSHLWHNTLHWIHWIVAFACKVFIKRAKVVVISGESRDE